jgi:hypothetical protein
LFTISTINEEEESVVQTVEISPGKSLYINSSLESNQQQKLIQMIQGQSGAFAWDYSDMKGIHPDTCIHHIYTPWNFLYKCFSMMFQKEPFG